MLHEGIEGRLHLPHPAGQPDGALLDHADLQVRVPLQHAVEDHRGQRLGRRAGDGHVVDGAEVLVAAVEVGDVGAAVDEVLRVQQLPAAADVQDDRDARLLGLPPDRVELDVAGGVVVRAAARHEQGGRPHLERFAGHGGRPVEVGERHVAGGQEPGIDRAELDHPAVVGAGRAVGQVEVAVPLESEQVAVVERVEHELAGHPEQVEGERPVLGDEVTPVALKFLRAMISSASRARNSGSAWRCRKLLDGVDLLLRRQRRGPRWASAAPAHRGRRGRSARSALP